MKPLKETIMSRDGISEEDFNELLLDAFFDLDLGEYPEEVLLTIFGIEPDWSLELLDLYTNHKIESFEISKEGER